MVSGSFGVPGVYRTPPGKYWAYMGLSGERGEPARGGRVPPHGSPNWTRGGGGTPFPSPSFSPPVRKERGANPTRSGVLVGLPPMARPLVASLLLPSFIYGDRGHPKAHQLFS